MIAFKIKIWKLLLNSNLKFSRIFALVEAEDMAAVLDGGLVRLHQEEERKS